jgi:hypothetical protein
MNIWIFAKFVPANTAAISYRHNTCCYGAHIVYICASLWQNATPNSQWHQYDRVRGYGQLYSPCNVSGSHDGAVWERGDDTSVTELAGGNDKDGNGQGERHLLILSGVTINFKQMTRDSHSKRQHSEHPNFLASIHIQKMAVQYSVSRRFWSQRDLPTML